MCLHEKFEKERKKKCGEDTCTKNICWPHNEIIHGKCDASYEQSNKRNVPQSEQNCVRYEEPSVKDLWMNCVKNLPERVQKKKEGEMFYVLSTTNWTRELKVSKCEKDPSSIRFSFCMHLFGMCVCAFFSCKFLFTFCYNAIECLSCYIFPAPHPLNIKLAHFQYNKPFFSVHSSYLSYVHLHCSCFCVTPCVCFVFCKSWFFRFFPLIYFYFVVCACIDWSLRFQ